MSRKKIKIDDLASQLEEEAKKLDTEACAVQAEHWDCELSDEVEDLQLIADTMLDQPKHKAVRSYQYHYNSQTGKLTSNRKRQNNHGRAGLKGKCTGGHHNLKPVQPRDDTNSIASLRPGMYIYIIDCDNLNYKEGRPAVCHCRICMY